MQAVCHEAASRKRPSTPTLLRRPSRWGLCGRCSHFGRTIHATHCQVCVWRHLAWTVIFGLSRLPLGYTFSRTMHHTSSQKGLRSGWQSGASEPHLLTRRCSNRRKFCGTSAPIAYATSGILLQRGWRNGCCVEEVAECAKVILLFQVRNPPVQSRSHQEYRPLFEYNMFQARLV